MIALSPYIAVLVAASLAASALGGGLSSLFSTIVFPEGFLADVTVEERHSDELRVTENPVEQGAAITDHAFKVPARLTLRVGFSNSNPLVGNPAYVDIVYQLFLLLQSSAIPFGLVTFKRLYSNLLITRLETFTDEKWSNAMMLTVEMREIILVSTQTVSVPPTQNMAAPGINGATQSTGSNSLTPGTGFNSSAVPGS